MLKERVPQDQEQFDDRFFEQNVWLGAFTNDVKFFTLGLIVYHLSTRLESKFDPEVEANVIPCERSE